MSWGVDLHSIRAVCITHFHTDHFADLLPLIHARYVDDIDTHTAPRPLTILGPRTIQERIEKMRDAMWPEKEQYTMDGKEVATSEDAVTVGDVIITPFPVRHTAIFPSVGYRIAVGKKKSLAYTGDVGGGEQEEAFEEGIKGADHLIIEAGAVKQSAGHLTVEQAIALAARLDVKHTILTHVAENRVAEVRTQIADKPTVDLAEDSMRVTL